LRVDTYIDGGDTARLRGGQLWSAFTHHLQTSAAAADFESTRHVLVLLTQLPIRNKKWFRNVHHGNANSYFLREQDCDCNVWSAPLASPAHLLEHEKLINQPSALEEISGCFRSLGQCQFQSPTTSHWLSDSPTFEQKCDLNISQVLIQEEMLISWKTDDLYSVAATHVARTWSSMCMITFSRVSIGRINQEAWLDVQSVVISVRVNPDYCAKLNRNLHNVSSCIQGVLPRLIKS
jgi:hypothetical protein